MKRYAIPIIAILIAFSSVMNAYAQRRQRREGRPRSRMSQGKHKVGDEAPDFELRTLESVLNAKAGQTNDTETVKLSSFKGTNTVVLLFSSYT